MARTYQVNVSKKGVVVSNHEGSQPFSLLTQAADYIAGETREQYGEDAAIAKVTVWETYGKRQELLDWFRANPTTLNPKHDVAIRWLVHY